MESLKTTVTSADNASILLTTVIRNIFRAMKLSSIEEEGAAEEELLARSLFEEDDLYTPPPPPPTLGL